jgi:hypothetical protein
VERRLRFRRRRRRSGTITLRSDDGPIPIGSYILSGILEVTTALDSSGSATAAVQVNAANDTITANGVRFVAVELDGTKERSSRPARVQRRSRHRPSEAPRLVIGRRRSRPESSRSSSRIDNQRGGMGGAVWCLPVSFDGHDGRRYGRAVLTVRIGVASPIAVFWRSAARVVTGANAMPSAAAIRNGATGDWEVRDSNTHMPHAAVVTTDAGVTFALDTSLPIDLTIQITSARPEVVYP